MMRELASGVVPILFGLAVLVTVVFSSTPGPSPNIQGLEDAVPAKTTMLDFPLRPVDAPKLELALSQPASVEDQPILPDQPAILPDQPAIFDQPAILANPPDLPAIIASVQDQPAILPAQLASVRDQPTSVPDQLAGVQDQPASVPDQLAGVQDQPAILPDQLASVRDQPASVPNPPPREMAEIVPLPRPRPPSVPLSRPHRQSERRQAQVEPQSFSNFFTDRAR
jgi:hypothetical protein